MIIFCVFNISPFQQRKNAKTQIIGVYNGKFKRNREKKKAKKI